MMKKAFILNFFKLYNTVWKLSLPFLKKNNRLKENFNARISASHHTRADLWIQAASAGEAYLAISIIKALSPERKLTILATSTTSQGLGLLRKELATELMNPLKDITIHPFPFDMPSTMQKTVSEVNPRVMVLLETEIWPALLFHLKKNRTKIMIINARLSRKSFVNYRRTRYLWRHLAPDLVLATSDQDAGRYQMVFEHTKVSTMPNIKFESIETNPEDSDGSKKTGMLLPGALPLTILASVRRQEEKESVLMVKKLINDFPEQVVAIFPRHMHRLSAWKKHLKSHDLDFYLRSGITASPLSSGGIILWDRFGELKATYDLASVAFVGGSLKPLGGQNFIEPAVLGVATITGPYYDDFAWATNDIFQKGIVTQKQNWQAVCQAILQTLENPVDRSCLKERAREYIDANRGGTLVACNEIMKRL